MKKEIATPARARLVVLFNDMCKTYILNGDVYDPSHVETVGYSHTDTDPLMVLDSEVVDLRVSVPCEYDDAHMEIVANYWLHRMSVLKESAPKMLDKGYAK